MKKIIAVILCLLLVSAPVAMADSISLEGTYWELGLIMIVETEERLFKDDIIERDLMITFQFKENGVVTMTMPDGSIDGEYRQTGNDLAMDYAIGSTTTTITERDGVYMLSFVNVFVEGQIHMFVRQSGPSGGSTPETPAPVDTTPAPTNPAPAVPTPAATPAPSQSVPELEGTTWVIVQAVTPDATYSREDLEALDYLFEFQFMKNGELICRARNNGRWIQEKGTYSISGYTLELDIPSLAPMSTTFHNDSFTIKRFDNTDEDFTFRQAATSSSGLPRWLQDAWQGALIGVIAAVILSVFGIIKKKKKKTAAANVVSEYSPTLPGQAPMPPAYNPMPAPASAAPVSFGAPPQLHCPSGPMAGATFPVNGSLRIGRDPSRCQIIFPEETKGVSSLHCEVQQQPSGVLLIDHGSSYGTFLSSGRKLNANESVALNTGDSFYLADSQNTFKVL